MLDNIYRICYTLYKLKFMLRQSNDFKGEQNERSNFYYW